jgi:hypothetical protein
LRLLNTSPLSINNRGQPIPSLPQNTTYISCAEFGQHIFVVTSTGYYNWYGNFVDSYYPFSVSSTPINIGTCLVGTYT